MLFGTNQRKPMGLFGGFAPSERQRMPDNPNDAFGLAEQQMMGQGGQQFAQSQAPKKPGINWLGVLADTLAGAAGREGPYAASMRAKQEQEAAQEHARQQRAASMQDWRTKFDYENEYERNNPKPHQPDDFERSLIGQGIMPGTPEWAEANRMRSLNFTDPTVTVNLPGGAIYSGPRSGLQAALGRSSGGNNDSTPTTEDGHSYTPGPGGRANPQNWKPVGGASGNAGPRFPVTGNSLDRITIQSESAGNPNAVSPKGARGLWQVMPATARDPGFGIKASNGTQADDARVGSEYRRKMGARYGGNLPKMWGAYNWGPGNVDKAIAKYGDNWLQYAPAETRAYVSRNMRAVRGGK